MLDVARIGLDAQRIDGLPALAPGLIRENAAAVELAESTEAQAQLLEALQAIDELRSGHATEQDLLELLAAIAKKLTGASAARAILFGGTHNRRGFVVEAAGGDGGSALRGARLLPHQGIALRVAFYGEPCVQRYAADHPAYQESCDGLPTRHPGFLCVPLRHRSIRGSLTVAGLAEGVFPKAALHTLSRLSRHAALQLEELRFFERSTNFVTHISNMLVSVLDALDAFEPGHSRATAALADMVTRRMGLSAQQRREVHHAALLHDVGKLLIPADALRAGGEEARRRLAEHPRLGVELLRPIEMWADILPIIQHHHERWDGTGYPTRLQGEDIPLGARVVAVAEAFDAMTRRKSYAPPRTPEEALAELERCAGVQFDPVVVRLFVAEHRARRGEHAAGGQLGGAQPWRGKLPGDAPE